LFINKELLEFCNPSFSLLILNPPLINLGKKISNGLLAFLFVFHGNSFKKTTGLEHDGVPLGE